jgi:hypothetical protein
MTTGCGSLHQRGSIQQQRRRRPSSQAMSIACFRELRGSQARQVSTAALAWMFRECEFGVALAPLSTVR